MKGRVALIGCFSLLLALVVWLWLGRDTRRATQRAASNTWEAGVGGDSAKVDPANEQPAKQAATPDIPRSAASDGPTDTKGKSGQLTRGEAAPKTRGATPPGNSSAPFMSPPSPPRVPPTSPAAHGRAEVFPEEVTLDLDKITLSLRDYRTVMRENPVGTNSEIAHALDGGNPRQARLLPNGQPVNGNGEMIDRWGTAYFFHQLSKDHMEIRSAGPDKTMWTPDDTVSN